MTQKQRQNDTETKREIRKQRQSDIETETDFREMP